MKKINRKRYIVITLFLISFLLIFSYLQYAHIVNVFPTKYRAMKPTKPVNVFGKPATQTKDSFPKAKPEFVAIIGSMKPATVQQHTISIYRVNDPKKKVVFQRGFYADGFLGNELQYAVSSSSATFEQSGLIGSIGCSNQDCRLPWRNFYTWDAKQQMFVLDNAAHKEAFEKLVAMHSVIDEKGCSIVSKDIIKGQENLSFTNLYKKYPSLSSYCSKSQGILAGNLLFFLQIKKTAERIVKGENVGSLDIRESSL